MQARSSSSTSPSSAPRPCCHSIWWCGAPAAHLRCCHSCSRSPCLHLLHMLHLRHRCIHNTWADQPQAHWHGIEGRCIWACGAEACCACCAHAGPSSEGLPDSAHPAAEQQLHVLDTPAATHQPERNARTAAAPRRRGHQCEGTHHWPSLPDPENSSTLRPAAGSERAQRHPCALSRAEATPTTSKPLCCMHACDIHQGPCQAQHVHPDGCSQACQGRLGVSPVGRLCGV